MTGDRLRKRSSVAFPLVEDLYPAVGAVLLDDPLLVLHVAVGLVRVDPGVRHHAPLALAPRRVQPLALGARAAPGARVAHLRLRARILADPRQVTNLGASIQSDGTNLARSFLVRAAYLSLGARRERASPRGGIPDLPEGTGRELAVPAIPISDPALAARKGHAAARRRVPHFPARAGRALTGPARVPEGAAGTGRGLAVAGQRVAGEPLGTGPGRALPAQRVSRLPDWAGGHLRRRALAAPSHGIPG